MRREPPIYFTTEPPRVFAGIDRSIERKLAGVALLRLPPSIRDVLAEFERAQLRSPEQVRLKPSKPLTLATVRRAARELIRMSNRAARESRPARSRPAR